MIFNYLKTGIRNIVKQSGYSIINIAGLAIGLAIFILSASFVDLAAAQYFSRTKEVGIRKVVGGTQTQPRWQFLGESVLLTLLAGLASVSSGQSS